MSEERIFDTKAKVFTWLQAQGYTLKESSFYNKAKYWLTPDLDKKYSMQAVDKFIQAAKLARGEEEVVETKEAITHNARRAKAEADLKEEQAAMAQLRHRKISGQLIERSEVELMLTARAVNLQAGLKNAIRSRMEDFVLAVRGDLDEVPAGMRLWEDVIDELLDRYAREGAIKVEAPRR